MVIEDEKENISFTWSFHSTLHSQCCSDLLQIPTSAFLKRHRTSVLCMAPAGALAAAGGHVLLPPYDHLFLFALPGSLLWGCAFILAFQSNLKHLAWGYLPGQDWNIPLEYQTLIWPADVATWMQFSIPDMHSSDVQEGRRLHQAFSTKAVFRHSSSLPALMAKQIFTEQKHCVQFWKDHCSQRQWVAVQKSLPLPLCCIETPGLLLLSAWLWCTRSALRAEPTAIPAVLVPGTEARL